MFGTDKTSVEVLPTSNSFIGVTTTGASNADADADGSLTTSGTVAVVATTFNSAGAAVVATTFNSAGAAVVAITSCDCVGLTTSGTVVAVVATTFNSAGSGAAVVATTFDSAVVTSGNPDVLSVTTDCKFNTGFVLLVLNVVCNS